MGLRGKWDVDEMGNEIAMMQLGDATACSGDAECKIVDDEGDQHGKVGGANMGFLRMPYLRQARSGAHDSCAWEVGQMAEVRGRNALA